MKKPNFKILRIGILLTIVSVLANLLFFAITKGLGEQYIIPMAEAPASTGPMPVIMVIFATFLSAIFATGLYSILAKVAPNATLPPFLSITGTALLVSFGGPMELPDTILQTKLLLSMMHLISAAIIMGGFIIFHRRSIKTVDR
jgi:type IV secretory pathway VirB6-like protein